MAIGDTHVVQRDKQSAQDESAQLRAIYQGLQRQMPLLYPVALANIAGLHLSTGGQLAALKSPATALILLLFWRLLHWIRQRNADPSPEKIAGELRSTLLMTIFLVGGFSAWAQTLLTSHPQATNSIVLFTSLAAIGCAYALSSYPLAARVPLIILGLPLATRLIFTGQTPEIGMGTSLLLIIGLIIRLLRVQDTSRRELVTSRIQLKDESERARAAQDQAIILAETDALTGLANRRALLAALETAFAENVPLALAFVDLDGFKPINDAFGHTTGDAVLEGVSLRLEARFSGEALVARIGGDEFAILWRGPRAAAGRQAAAEVADIVNTPMLIGHRVLRVFACCGVVLADSRESGPTDLMRQADTALYAAKTNGRGQFVAFSDALHERQLRQAAVESALADGTARDELRVVFQPIRNLLSGRIECFEALARWSNDALGQVPPMEFIPAAERMDLISDLTDEVLDLTIRAARSWPDDIRVSFNVSALELCNPNAAERLLRKLKNEAFDPRRFQAEVTETALLSDFDTARYNVAALRRAGATIALDDFGAGHASISYLREMRFDAVKLDGSLMSGFTTSSQGRSLIAGVIALCRSLGVRCVAEHVETRQELKLLSELGCDFAQGYLIGRPVEPDRVQGYVEMRGRRRAA